MKNDKAGSISPDKKEIVNKVFSPINIFIHSEKIELFSPFDNPLKDLARPSDTAMSKDRSENWTELSLTKELNYLDKINFNTANMSTIKIDEPWGHFATLEQSFLSPNYLEKKLAPAIKNAKEPNDPVINFTNISPILKNGNKKLFSLLDNKQLADVKKVKFCDYVVVNEKNLTVLVDEQTLPLDDLSIDRLLVVNCFEYLYNHKKFFHYHFLPQNKYLQMVNYLHYQYIYLFYLF